MIFLLEKVVFYLNVKSTWMFEKIQEIYFPQVISLKKITERLQKAHVIYKTTPVLSSFKIYCRDLITHLRFS